MVALEDLRPSASVLGIAPDGLVTVVNVRWNGSDALAYCGLVRSWPRTARIAGEQCTSVETQGVFALYEVQE